RRLPRKAQGTPRSGAAASGRLSFGYFSLAEQRKVTRASKARNKNSTTPKQQNQKTKPQSAASALS
ncbi:MAG TPA: hypothetical protein VIR60_06020, partial [Gammaproteobacteria bacterium]